LVLKWVGKKIDAFRTYRSKSHT